MTPYITRALAQQIVDTVRDLCGQNVNFIDCSGTIFASTDATRIGTFHEIGQQTAERGVKQQHSSILQERLHRFRI